MMKKAIKSMICLAVGGLCAALIFETFLRVVEVTPAWQALPIAEVSLYGPDENTAYTHRPNIHGIWVTENRAHVSTTSFGIRANGLKNESIEQGDDWFKIGLVGNSITEALQVDDNQTFVALSEKILQQSAPKTRIYNLGLSGSPPAVEAQRAAYFAHKLDLDLIIIIDQPENITHRIGASQGNTMPYYKRDSAGGISIDRTYLKSRKYKIRQSGAGQIFYYLMDHLRVMTVVNNRLNRGVFAELTAQYKAQQKSVAQHTRECSEDSLNILAHIESPEYTEQRQLLDAFVNDLAAVHHRENTRVVFALYDAWEDCPGALHTAGYKNLEQYLRNKDIAFLDLTTALKKNLPPGAGQKDLRGFGLRRGEGHLNKKGHQIFAQTLVEYIRARR